MKRLWIALVCLALSGMLFAPTLVSAQDTQNQTCSWQDLQPTLEALYSKEGAHPYNFRITLEDVGVRPCQFAVANVDVWKVGSEYDFDSYIHFSYLLWQNEGETLVSPPQFDQHSVGQVITFATVYQGKASFYTANIIPKTSFSVITMDEKRNVLAAQPVPEAELPTEVYQAFRAPVGQCGWPSKLAIYEKYMQDPLRISFDRISIGASNDSLWVEAGNCVGAYTTVVASNSSNGKDTFTTTYFAYMDKGTQVFSEGLSEKYYLTQFPVPLLYGMANHTFHMWLYFDRGQVDEVFVFPDGHLSVNRSFVWKDLITEAIVNDGEDTAKPVSYRQVVLAIPFKPESLNGEYHNFEVAKWRCLDTPCTIQMMSVRYTSFISGEVPYQRFDAFARFYDGAWHFVGLVKQDSSDWPTGGSVSYEGGGIVSVQVCLPQAKKVNTYLVPKKGSIVYHSLPGGDCKASEQFPITG